MNNYRLKVLSVFLMVLAAVVFIHTVESYEQERERLDYYVEK